MKKMQSAFRFLTVLLLLSGSFATRVSAFPQSQTGDIPEDEISTQLPQTDTALPERFDVPAETFPISRVQIEVDSTDRLSTLRALGFECNQLGACVAETDQTALATLKEFGFDYAVLRQGIAVQIDPSPDSLDALVNWYGGDDIDYAIPDSTSSTCGWAYSTVNITDAPAGETVEFVEYRIRVLHTWPSDLQLLITSGQNTREVIWNFLGGSDDGGNDDDAEADDDIYLDHRLINGPFNGQPVNQVWYLDAYDCVVGDTGTIDYLELWIWYDDGSGGTLKPNLTPYIPSGWDFPIVPSSVSGTNTVNDLFTTRPTYIDLAVINNGSADISTGFDSCLFMDSTMLNCWTWNDGLQINYYWYLTDWVMNVTPSVGWHTLRIEADYYRAVAESNENDNTWRYEFYWNPTHGKTYLPFLTTLKTFFEGPAELEPNSKYNQANGALISNRVYSGLSNDSDDYFYFTANASGTIQVNISGHTGQGVQLLLYYQSVEAGAIKQCNKAPGSTSCTINHDGGPGLYYVRIYTGLTPYTNQTYSLQVTYP
jgi:hypothetical protein